MYVFITILIIVICVLLCLVVLIQNPKGGGVNSTFGGASQQIFGASRTTDVVEKTTWTLAVLLIVFSLCSAFFIDRKGIAAKNNAKQSSNAPAPSEVSEVEKRLKETGGLNTPMPQGAPQQGQQQQQPQQPAKK